MSEVTSLITKGTTPKKYTERGISFIKTEALKGAHINLEKLSFIDKNTHNTILKRSILEHNDILITITGATIGKCAIVPKEALPANTNQNLAIVRLNNNVNVKYIFYLMTSHYMIEYISQNSKASAQPSLNLKQINNFPIPYPSPEEQERVVNILDKFDLLTTSINEGLPKEIELRNKQYEYYRNKLLTFPNVKVEA
ncbi:type I restriction-modification system specificity subunit S [Nonlabens ulvanivorans]|uniref:Type I restriction-modification system specificity subunit S n=1 Tax=Nonlabens ulvanivorans TaxID=906888 RepID=A0A090WG49_NONUL|nr:restriction endonuclease subunit S [Nonlabens ulvanivorans]GAL75980.1 type I restriction-modification system specificity subunit S [Nonlabens ulvanivorans]